jgi:hypothetical protein
MEAFQHNAGAIKKGRPNRSIGAGFRFSRFLSFIAEAAD